MIRFFIGLALMTQACVAQSAWFGPDNYEDCILEGIPTAKTDLAVRTVISACRNKFPAERKANATYPETEASGISDRSGAYACEQVGGNQLVKVVVDENNGTVLLNDSEHKVTMKTEKKIYTEKYAAGDFTDIYLAFETPFASLKSDVNTTLEWRYRNKSSGQEGSNIYRCKKST